MKPLTLLFCLFLLLTGCEQSSIPKGTPDDPIVAVDPDDPEMAAAEAKARATLDEFIQALQSPAPNQSEFGVKHEFRENGESEHMWITDLSFSDGKFSGRLGNTPGVLKNIKEGDAVSIDRSEVEDWLYFQDGDLVGGHTVKVLMGRE